MFSKSKPMPDSESVPSPAPTAPAVPAKMATGARHATFSIIGSDVVITGNVAASVDLHVDGKIRSEEHTSELQSLMRISYAVFCMKKKNTSHLTKDTTTK